MRALTIRTRCAGSGCGGWMWYVCGTAGRCAAGCRNCGAVRELEIDAHLDETRSLERCPVCQGGEFYVRKDFPQRLGLLIVATAGVFSCILIALRAEPWAWGVLALSVVVDVILFALVGTATVCYRCRTEFRGTAYNPRYQNFDLATSEKYE